MTTPMTTPANRGLFAERALLADGWARDVRVTLSADGRIAAVEAGAAVQAGDERLAGRILLPAPSNLHSHAFQRAMAGLTERARIGAEDSGGEGNGGEDSFWTWREVMYGFVRQLGPDQVQAIAELRQDLLP